MVKEEEEGDTWLHAKTPRGNFIRSPARCAASVIVHRPLIRCACCFHHALSLFHLLQRQMVLRGSFLFMCIVGELWFDLWHIFLLLPLSSLAIPLSGPICAFS